MSLKFLAQPCGMLNFCLSNAVKLLPRATFIGDTFQVICYLHVRLSCTSRMYQKQHCNCRCHQRRLGKVHPCGQSVTINLSADRAHRFKFDEFKGLECAFMERSFRTDVRPSRGESQPLVGPKGCAGFTTIALTSARANPPPANSWRGNVPDYDGDDDGGGELNCHRHGARGWK